MLANVLDRTPQGSCYYSKTEKGIDIRHNKLDSKEF